MYFVIFKIFIFFTFKDPSASKLRGRWCVGYLFNKCILNLCFEPRETRSVTVLWRKQFEASGLMTESWVNESTLSFYWDH